MSDWYVKKADKQMIGPLTFDQLKDMGTRGQLGLGDMVWNEGGSLMVPIDKVPGLVLIAPPSTSARHKSEGWLKNWLLNNMETIIKTIMGLAGVLFAIYMFYMLHIVRDDPEVTRKRIERIMQKYEKQNLKGGALPNDKTGGIEKTSPIEAGGKEYTVKEIVLAADSMDKNGEGKVITVRGKVGHVKSEGVIGSVRLEEGQYFVEAIEFNPTNKPLLVSRLGNGDSISVTGTIRPPMPGLRRAQTVEIHLWSITRHAK